LYLEVTYQIKATEKQLSIYPQKLKTKGYWEMYSIVGNLYYDLIYMYLSENVYVDISAAVPIQILMIIVLKHM